MCQNTRKTSMSSSPHHTYQNPNSNPIFDEERWIIHIRTALDEDDLEQEFEIPVSIFNIPKTLKLINPESYAPQLVALGPYHHHRPDLHEMERYKLAAARRSQKHLPGLKFQDLVNHLTKFEPKFRASYHKFLDFKGETLAWMMAVDSCFLLEFLQIFAVEKGKIPTKVSPRMSHLVDKRGRKSGYNAVLRDIVMLENQIPLFSLRKVLEFQLGSSGEADDMLYPLLIGFGKELLPVKTIQEWPDVNQVTRCAHMLDFLYRSIVPELEGSASEIASEEDINEGENRAGGPVSLIKRLLTSKLIQLFVKLPWKIVSNLPGVILIKQIEYLWFSQENGENGPENENCDKHPLMEEIAIPSVTELSRAGVRFSVTNSGIFGIGFDVKTAIFHLPTICLDVNTEIAIRNLVAYEAFSASGPLIFTRYTELMNGIIDTEEDAKLLREKGIVLNHLKSDGGVANLWNGMSKSIRLTKVPFLDKVIEDVNNYYNGKWKVRIGKFLKRHVFASWQFMTLLAAVLLLFFVSLQVLCSLFSFVRVFLYRKRMT